MDHNIGTLCSNALDAKPIHNMKRYSQRDQKSIQIEHQYVLKKYVADMGDVDRCDENISIYRTPIIGEKWYFSLTSQWINMAVYNAMQLHRVN